MNDTKNPKEKVFTVLTAVLVLFLAIAIAFKFGGKKEEVAFPEGTTIEEFTFVPDSFANDLVFSPIKRNLIIDSVEDTGEFQSASSQKPAGVEEEVFEDDDAETDIETFVIDYPDGSQAINAKYESSLSVEELEKKYNEKLPELGWNIITSEVNTNTAFVRATRDTEEISVTIASTPEGKNTAVTLLYKK